MQVVCVGGGPAGLYLALLLKRTNPAHDVTVIERNRPHDTFGWGVVFSDQTLGNLREADAASYEEIAASFNHWDDIDVHFKGRTIRSGGHGFCGIGRRHLLNILQARCEALGVRLVFQTDFGPHAEFTDADLIIGSDGIHSRIRERFATTFQPQIQTGRCRFVWLGTKKLFDAFTFAFEETEHGWFQAHAYRYDGETSTFIVETPEEVWLAHGIDQMTQDEGIAFCEQLFAKYLDGHGLMSNASHQRGSAMWIKFPRVHCEHWVVHHFTTWGRRMPIALLGDAAHTAHFSIGSGTKLALEDAIALNRALASAADVDAALDAYQAERKLEVLKLQNAARNSTEWFENVSRYTAMEAEQFTYSLLTRSQRLTHENLKVRDPEYIARMEAWLARKSEGMLESGPAVARGLDVAPPPMFTPFRVRGLTLSNRVVVSPMAMYSCVDGTPDDFMLVHLGSRAQGGAALVFTEMTCVSPDGRISPGCAGMYKPEHVVAWQRVVAFVKAHTHARIGMQLGHSGPKGSTQRGWEESDAPLPSGNWPLLACSPIAYGPDNQMPKPMTRADMDVVCGQFVDAARGALECGFDWLELHCAHGYLLSSFLSPLTNVRGDEYGGSIANRCRFPLEVFRAIRAVWPAEKPMSVRISAHDWAPEGEHGNTPDDAVEIARLFKAAGCDMIDVSSGQTTRLARPVYGRMYQTPFADRIRQEVGIGTIAVGAIFEADHVNSIIASGRADLCALGRPHLADPFWTLHAAAAQGYRGVEWPVQYLQGRNQLERNLARTQLGSDTNSTSKSGSPARG